MRNISDIIEQYLKQVIDLSNNNVIEIKEMRLRIDSSAYHLKSIM